MYAQLGSIIFENLKGFTDFSKASEATYAEHNPIIGKPKLEPTGVSLEEINLSIRLHASFCNPGQELDLLKEMRDNFGVLPLIWGNGKVEGDFVITSISETVEDADAQGNVFSYIVALNLKEFIVSDRLQILQTQSRKNAIAVGDKRPVLKMKTNLPPPIKLTTDTALKIDVNTKAIDNIILQQGGINTDQKRHSVLEKLKSIDNAYNDLQGYYNKVEEFVIDINQVKGKADTVKAVATDFYEKVKNREYDNVLDYNKSLVGAVRELKKVLNPVILSSIVNNG